MSHTPEEVLQHPDLSDDAKLLFRLLIHNAECGLDGVEIPEWHWWSQRDTGSMLAELAYFGVFGYVVVGS